MSDTFRSLWGYFYVKKLKLSSSDCDECYVIASIFWIINLEFLYNNLIIGQFDVSLNTFLYALSFNSK